MFPTVLPQHRADRWHLLDEALRRWFVLPPDDSWGTPTSHLDDAEHRLGLTLPPGLREWFERYGALTGVWSLQDRLLAPTELQVKSEVLVLCSENQDVVEWGIRVSDLALEDPPIVVSGPAGRDGWTVEADRTTTFALLFATMNVKWSDAVKCRANGQLTSNAVTALERTLGRLPFGEQHWLHARFYGDADLVVEAQADTWLWVSSLSQSRLAEVDALITAAGVTWDEIEDGTHM